jgi:uncharacterized membrane protein YfcA
MDLLELSSNYSLMVLASLGLLAFVAGFIDAVVGGGGLIQLPALLINLPNQPLPTIFGTNKIAALSGTSIAAWQYAKRIKFNLPLLLTVSLFAFAFSYIGAKTVSLINVNVLKPVILVVLILIAIYTFIKKDMGAVQTKHHSTGRLLFLGSLIGTVIGFYDGFFGPGTGSFLVLGFVVLLGFEFVTASGYAKIINCMTNISALVVFVRQGNYLLHLALLMAVCNIAGSMIGSRLAIKRGNRFVRIIFLVIVTLMIVRYGYAVLMMLK